MILSFCGRLFGILFGAGPAESCESLERADLGFRLVDDFEERDLPPPGLLERFMSMSLGSRGLLAEVTPLSANRTALRCVPVATRVFRMQRLQA